MMLGPTLTAIATVGRRHPDTCECDPCLAAAELEQRHGPKPALQRVICGLAAAKRAIEQQAA